MSAISACEVSAIKLIGQQVARFMNGLGEEVDQKG
jgi:hypothetical protein